MKIAGAPVTERDLIFGEISNERQAQDQQWGGKIHDDSHDLYDWLVYIRKQHNYAERAALNGDKAAFEARMVKVGALALAAIESSRRQR